MPDAPQAAGSPAAEPDRTELAVRWSGLTDRGRFRENNEDVFLALTFDGHEVHYLGKTGTSDFSDHDFIFAVSDGMGGAKAGEFASKITVERVTRLLPRAFRLSAAGLSSGFADVLGELFASIHRDLGNLSRSYEECSGMGATLTLAWFAPAWLYFGHIGDSRLYHLPAAGGIRPLTRDDTHVGWLRQKGRINEREARTHPGRNALQQALGAGTQVIDPQIGAVELVAGDRFLICSDGVIDGIWDRRLDELARLDDGAAPAAQRIVQEAVAESGRDNATAVVVEVMANRSSSQPPATAP
jgi:serine/threonine protein phosphatase PrpC